jgi:predicted GNAT family acetyltransferase
VVDVPEASRYELRQDGRMIGLAAYRAARDGRIVFTHTEVTEGWEGRGFGSRLAAAALDDARRQGLAVRSALPVSSRTTIEQHPDYQDLCPGDYRRPRVASATHTRHRRSSSPRETDQTFRFC